MNKYEWSEVERLLAEIRSWNDGDIESAKESDSGLVFLDEETLKNRAEIIEELKMTLTLIQRWQIRKAN